MRAHLANTVSKGFFMEGSPFNDARIASDLADAGFARATAAANESEQKPPSLTNKRQNGDAEKSAGGGAPPAKKLKKPEKADAAAKSKTAKSVADKMKLALAALGSGGAPEEVPEAAEADDEED